MNFNSGHGVVTWNERKSTRDGKPDMNKEKGQDVKIYRAFQFFFAAIGIIALTLGIIIGVLTHSDFFEILMLGLIFTIISMIFAVQAMLTRLEAKTK